MGIVKMIGDKPVVGKFEKVSKETYRKSLLDISSAKGPQIEKLIDEAYDSIKLPKRSTTGSAGYDIFLPIPIRLGPADSVLIPTGIKVRMNEGWVFVIAPRSGLGFKYRLQIDNTIGIIDSDYYNNPNNEGHILISITNDLKINNCVSMNPITNKMEIDESAILSLPAGKAVAQGLFLPFGITEDDDVSAIREGGLGSTDKEDKPKSSIILE